MKITKSVSAIDDDNYTEDANDGEMYYPVIGLVTTIMATKHSQLNVLKWRNRYNLFKEILGVGLREQTSLWQWERLSIILDTRLRNKYDANAVWYCVLIP